MCIRLPKQLNPNAQVWTPPPPPSENIQVLPSPTASMSTYPSHPSAVYKFIQPYYLPLPLMTPLIYFPAPAAHGFRRKAAKPTSEGGETIHIPPKYAESQKGALRRSCPPRLRRPARFFSREKKPTKLEWRPKKLVEAGNETAVDCGAVSPVGPLSGRGCYPSCNTTVMIKNIPSRLRRDDILKFLDCHCCAYSLEYDFLYLPMDFRQKGNLGYAFVNFTTAIAATKFKNILHNYKWGTVKTDGGSFTSKKICEITWARVQGKDFYTKRFGNAKFACDERDFLPVVLDPPRNGSDPNPGPPLVLGELRSQFSSKNY